MTSLNAVRPRTLLLGAALVFVLVVVVVVALIIALVRPSASGGTASTAPYYLIDSATGAEVPVTQVNRWDYDVSGSPVPANEEFDFADSFAAPEAAGAVMTFVSRPGDESDPSKWLAYAPNAFVDADEAAVMMPAARLSGQTGGEPDKVQRDGGEYSLGFAFMDDAAATVLDDAVYFTRIDVEPGSGDWTYGAD
jgi:hypothetical protein